MKMTTEEAFVKVLQMHGIRHSFGIIGSAFMPISDLFPKAGITLPGHRATQAAENVFIAHRTAAHRPRLRPCSAPAA